MSNEVREDTRGEGLEILKGIRHLFHAAIRIERDHIIYIDPLRIEGAPHDADLIFCTHDHFDHFSPEDINKVIKEEGTVLVVPACNVKECEKIKVSDVIGVEPNNSYEVKGINFKTALSHNNPDRELNSLNRKGIGYIIDLERANYYFVGDIVDCIPEMEDIEADVVFLPVGGIYSMDAIEAANVANIIKPRIAIPIHFGDLMGTKEDAKIFVENLSEDIEGIILK